MSETSNRRMLIAFECAAMYAYLPLVIVPLFFWRWKLSDHAWANLCAYLALALLLPLLAIYFYGSTDKHVRKSRLITGFAVYAACYLLGNSLGLHGGRWYWVHLTALTMLFATGMALKQSNAYALHKATVVRILRGHWIFVGTLIAMVELNARVHAWIAFDYVWGIYFAWCAWRVAGLKGLEEDAESQRVVETL